jgi:hypothetical protein
MNRLSSRLVDFEWDPEKAEANLAKRGVSFEDASTAFVDPLSVVRHAMSDASTKKDDDSDLETDGLAARLVLLSLPNATSV